MSVEPTEVHVVSLPSDLPAAPLPPPSNPWRLTGFRLAMIALLLLVLGFVLAIWHTDREVDQFIKLESAMVEATCNQAKLAHHDGRDADAARLFQQCHEGVLTMERYAKDRSEAASDMEVEKNRETMRHLFDKQGSERKPK